MGLMMYCMCLERENSFCYGMHALKSAIIKKGQQPKTNYMSTAKKIFFLFFGHNFTTLELAAREINFLLHLPLVTLACQPGVATLSWIYKCSSSI